MAASEVTFLKQAAKRILAKPPARKFPITVAILFAIFKLLDFRSPLHVGSFPCCFILTIAKV